MVTKKDFSQHKFTAETKIETKDGIYKLTFIDFENFKLYGKLRENSITRMLKIEDIERIL